MSIVTGIRSGIRTGIRAGVNPGAVDAPTDGPDSVFVPETTAHFEALSIPPPTDLYTCDEASGDLASATGTDPLVASGTGHLYEQSVAGWSSPFVGQNDGDDAAWSNDSGLAAGESCFVLALLAMDASTNSHVLFFGSTSDRVVLLSNGDLRTSHGGVDSEGLEDYADLANVHAVMWSRNATDDASGTFTDAEPISGTHDESEIAASDAFSVMRSGAAANPGTRFCRVYRWKGSDADALIAAGLANETLLTTLGWPLGAGYP